MLLKLSNTSVETNTSAYADRKGKLERVFPYGMFFGL